MALQTVQRISRLASRFAASSDSVFLSSRSRSDSHPLKWQVFDRNHPLQWGSAGHRPYRKFDEDDEDTYSFRHSRDGYEDPYKLRATTILCVRKGGKVVMIGDGQVSLGHTVVKPNAKKVRKLTHGVILGFAGATADCLTLSERLEERLEEYSGQLLRSCVEMAKMWRTDKYLRKLDAVMLAADKTTSLMLTGNGDVLEPFEDVLAIGSGGSYALSAARALMTTDLSAEEIAKRAMQIAGDICVYTNTNFTVEVIDFEESDKQATVQPKIEDTKPKSEAGPAISNGENKS